MRSEANSYQPKPAFRLAFICAAVIVLSSCATLESARPNAIADPDNTELAEIREADQADRTAGANVDWSKVGPRDEARLARVRELLAAGGVRTARDYFNAALVAQHGKTVDDIRLALSLATISASIDPNVTSAKWLSAAAWDRIMMRRKLPQWYGTQFSRSKEAGAKWELYKIDETIVSDEERKQLGVPTLEEARARARKMNGEK
jgi:hypothetical protein